MHSKKILAMHVQGDRTAELVLTADSRLES